MASGWHSRDHYRAPTMALPQSISNLLSSLGLKWTEIEWLCFN